MSLLFIVILGVLAITAATLRYTQYTIIFAVAAAFVLLAKFQGVNDIGFWIFIAAWLIALGVAYKTKLKKGKWAATGAGIVGAAVLFIPVGAAVAATLDLPVNNGIVKTAVQSSILMKDVPAPQSQECAAGPHYYAYDAEPGTHNFGAAIQMADAAAGSQRFATKAHCDPLWLATVKAYLQEGSNFDPTTVQDEAKSYVTDHVKWDAAIQEVYGQIDSFELADAGNVQYASLGMVPGNNPNEMPTLTKFGTEPSLGQVLAAKLKNGTVRNFRGICDLQPAEEEFSKVPQPVVPEKTPTLPPKKITVPPSSPPTTTTPPEKTTTPSIPTTTTTVPSTTTTVPSTSTTTTPPTSTTTTPPVTTTTTTPPETTTTTTPPETTTTPPTTTTTKTCENGGTPPECHNPKGTYTYPSGKPSDNKTTGPKETEPPVQTSKADPSTKPSQERTDVTAPGATQESRTTTPEPVHTGESSPPVNPDMAGAFVGFGATALLARYLKDKRKKGEHQ